MNYTIRAPQYAPDWFIPGIECKVKTKDNDRWSEIVYTITWYSEDRGFIDSEGNTWAFAIPIKTEYIQLPIDMFKEVYKLSYKKSIVKEELNDILHEYGCEVI